MTRIATLICVYSGDNAAHFREALDSILGQRLSSNIESRIYLGVDGPLPPTIECVIAEYMPSLHRVVRMLENEGLARMLNALIEQLEDETLIFRMDADDVSLDTRYQAQIDYMAANPDVDLLGTAILEFGEGVEGERVVHFASGAADALVNAHKRVPVAHPTVCMRRTVLDLTGGYPVRGTNEDVALWFRCLQLGLQFDNLPKVQLRFRIGRSFWKRRGLEKAWIEFTTYVLGIRALHGPISLRYVYPLLRLFMRLAPTGVSRFLYRSRIRLRPRQPQR
jgi:hypothetical protein